MIRFHDDCLFGEEIICSSKIKKKYISEIKKDNFLGHLSSCNKIFKRELIINKKLKMREDMELGEDREFNKEAILNANSIGVVDKYLYHYVRENNDSSTNSLNGKKIDSYLYDRKLMYDFVMRNINNKNEKQEYLSLYNKRIFYKLLDYCLKKSNNLDKHNVREVKEIFLKKEFQDSLYFDFELILVDDGSPDNCGEICDEYEQNDSRIKVIHKENGGQSTARNAALDIARGDYIGFVDSDDWIESDMYELLYDMCTKNNCEIANCTYTSYYEDKTVI